MTLVNLSAWTYRVGGDGLEPIVIEIEEHHLRLSSLEDEVSKLLYLEASLEGELQLTALDHDVGEIQQMNLNRETRVGELHIKGVAEINKMPCWCPHITMHVIILCILKD